MSNSRKYYVDGSSPKRKYYTSAYAIFRGSKIIKQKVLDENVNVYEIEFLALLECLKIAVEKSIIYSDSTQVVTEVNIKKTPKNKDYFKRARELMEEKKIKVMKIGRDDNPAGIYLENRLIKLRDSRNSILKTPGKGYGKTKKEKIAIYVRRKNLITKT